MLEYMLTTVKDSLYVSVNLQGCKIRCSSENNNAFKLK